MDGPASLIIEFFGAVDESAVQIMGRITNVRLGHIEDGRETFLFDFDGKLYKAVQKDRLRGVVIGISQKADLKMAYIALIDKLASPVSGTHEYKSSKVW